MTREDMRAAVEHADLILWEIDSSEYPVTRLPDDEPLPDDPRLPPGVVPADGGPDDAA